MPEWENYCCVQQDTFAGSKGCLLASRNSFALQLPRTLR